MEAESQPEVAPTWLSIVTKAKRFSANATTVIQLDNNAVLHPPKKNKNIRIIEEEEEEDDGKIGKSLFIGGPPLVAVLPRASSTASSCSSSPSPRLTSCGSTSSAEDDFSSSTATTPLSTLSIAASHPFPIMQKITMPSNLYMQQLHQAPSQATQSLYQYGDHSEISIKNTSTSTSTGGSQDLMQPTKAFNQISVIKSTHSFLRHNPKRHSEEDEPQDLSVKKPKRLPTSSFNNNYPQNSTSSSTDEAEEPSVNSFEDDDNDDCVQNLSRNNFSSLIPNNRVGPIIKNSFTHNNNTDNKAIKAIHPHYIDPKRRFSELQQFPESHQPNKKRVVVKVSNLICSNQSIEDNSNSNSNLPSSSYQNHLYKQEVEDYESNDLIIVDTTTPIPQTNYAIVNGKEDAKFHEIRINKEIETKEYLETEIEVKNRRGRKRKDEDQTVGKFDCFLCTFTCIRETLLKNHMIRMHTVKGNRGNVKCTVCAYSCPTMEQLRSHQELIHGQGQTKETEGILGGITESPKVAFHSCHHCTKKFRSQSQLQAHLRLIAQKQLWKDLKTRKVK